MQNDLALTVADRLRTHLSRVVHRAGEKGILRACRHDDLPAIGDQQLPVFGKVVQCAGIHLNADEPRAVKVQRGSTSARERNGAEPRADHTLVGYPIAQQRDVAAVGGSNRSLVDDAALSAPAESARVAGKTGRIDVERGRDNRTDIDLRRRSKQHAIGIDQPDLSIGRKAPEDGAGRAAHDPVDSQCARAWLDEINGMSCVDIETLPVQLQRLTALLNRGRRARLADRAGTRNTLSASWIAASISRCGQQE